LYRIRGAQIEIPSLRERTNIREVVEEIIRHQSDYDFENVTIEDDVWGFFESYDWPGNIRELRSALMYALCLSDDLRVTIDDLPDELVKAITGADFGLSKKSIEQSNGQDNMLDPGTSELEAGMTEPSLYKTNFLAEARHIEEFLKKNNWNVSATAQALGISRSTLHRKIKKYEIIAPNKLS
jgi:transcriptional regulator of acetoin/glycerol metabolism